MTNLELMICEAENSGEIDLDTRDMLLDVLNESTFLEREKHKRLIKKAKPLIEERYKLMVLKRKFKSEGNQKMVAVTDEKIRKLTSKLDDIHSKMPERYRLR